MRRLLLLAGFAAALLTTGCPPGNLRNPPFQGRGPAETPKADQLVKYLNDNSARLQSVECRDLIIDAQQGSQPVGLTGMMVCQKPRNFRLNGIVVGKPAVDLGSNNDEFWWWISQSQPPYLFHCSYQDLASGKARMPFPFQPEWVMEALGMGTYDPSGEYEVQTTQTAIQLVLKTRSPQGQPIRKVTVFNRQPSRSGQPGVSAYLLQDANGKEICSATVSEVQYDQGSGAVVPRTVQLVWPEQQIKLKLKLATVQVNANVGDRAARLFGRPQLPNIQSFDLARGLDQPAGQVQRAGALMR